MNYYGSPQAPRTAILSDGGSAGVSEGVSGCLNAGQCFCGMLKLLGILPDTEVSQTVRTDPCLRPYMFM